MDATREPRTVRLDSASLRVLAHPLRSRLLAALRIDGPATSTSLAKRLGTNSGATSYHLRKLAEVGLVEEDRDRGGHRERWWHAAHEMTAWTETDFIDDPDDRAAAEWLAGTHSRAKMRWIDHWLATRHEWPKEWRDAADSSDFGLMLSPSQAAQMNADIHAVVMRYAAEGPVPGVEPERVIVVLETFPVKEMLL